MSGKKETRRSFLETLGIKKPSKIESLMAEMKDALDKKGVDRKELDEEKTKGFLEKLIMDMSKVVGKLSDDTETVEAISRELAALAVGGLLEASQGTPVEDEVEEIVESEDEPMAETETMADDEEDEEEAEQLMELTESVKALADESNEHMKAMNELIPAFVDMAKVVEELKPLTKEAGKIEALIARIERIEKKQNARPRAASSAKETVVESDELKSQIKKGAEGVQTVLGLPVKDKV